MMDFVTAVRQGLQRQIAGAPESHPDSDLLTAFAERALAERERIGILQHLGLCSECRQVVSLAMPEVMAEVPLAAAQAPVVWRRWLVVRWAAVAAAAIVVAGGVTLYRSQQQGGQVAQLNPPTTSVAPSTPPVAPSQPSQAAKAEQAAAPVTLADTKPVAVPSTSNKVAATRSNEAIPSAMTRQTEVSTLAKVAVPPAAPPIAPSTDTVVAGLQNVPTSDPGVSAALVGNGSMTALPTPFGIHGTGAALAPSAMTETAFLSSPEPAEPGNAPSLRIDRHSRNAPVFTLGGGRNSLAGPKAFNSTLNAPRSGWFSKSPNLHAQWMVSPEGDLKHSHDGELWQSTKVAGYANFTAVGCSGNDVWAAAPGGALFHSFDDGATWQKVSPSFEGMSLHSDVTGIHLRRPLDVELTTVTGETWTSTDGHDWTRRK